jgi:hypothetical protein
MRDPPPPLRQDQETGSNDTATPLDDGLGVTSARTAVDSESLRVANNSTVDALAPEHRTAPRFLQSRFQLIVRRTIPALELGVTKC